MERKSPDPFTIVVTRPRSQAGEMAQSLRKSGVRVLLTPLIKTIPPSSYAGLDKSLRDIRFFDAAVFTSKNAVDHFFGRARRLGLKRLVPPGKTFAIGRKTAQALAKNGWRRALTAEDSRGEGLARLMGEVRGWRVLFPRAKAARELLPRLLRRRGAAVPVVEAYRTIPDEDGLRRLRTLRPQMLDAVTFTSPSTVDQFVKALGPARCRKLFSQAAAASIGPVTSAALRKYGIPPAVEAKTARAEALCRDLLRYLKRRTSRRSRA